LWPWSLGASLIAWLALLPGSILFDHYIGVPNPDATIAVLTLTAFGLLLLTICMAYAHDVEPRLDSRAASAMSG
jgi:hypothetical protein